MSGLNGRVERLEDAVTPGACCRVTTWFDACEPQKAALARLGKVGPDDVVVLLANWTPCNRPRGHHHRDAEVVITPRR